MIWYLVSFGAGWLACWWLMNKIMRYVFKRKPDVMTSIVRNLGPDAFARLRDLVEDEQARRQRL